MTVYIITIILIVGLQPVLNLIFGSEKYKGIYVFFIGTWLFLISALRDKSVGSDFSGYLRMFTLYGNTPWRDLIDIAKKSDIEIGYVAFNKIIYMISDNPRVLACIIAFILIFVFSREIKRNSNNPAFSYFLFVTMGMLGRSFNVMRQQIAVALALLAYPYIKEKKFIKFLIIILIAFHVHMSVVIVLPMYFIMQTKINYKVYFAFLVSCILCITIGDRLLSLFIYQERYIERYTTFTGERNGAVGECIIFSAFIILISIIWGNHKTGEMKFYMHFAMFCLLISCLTFVQPIIDRMEAYFDLVMIYAIPNTVSRVEKLSTRYFIICSVCAVTLFYYLCIICRADPGEVVPYVFCWN